MQLEGLTKKLEKLFVTAKENQKCVSEVFLSTMKCCDLSKKNGDVYQHLVSTCVVHFYRENVDISIDAEIEEILSRNQTEGGIGTVTASEENDSTMNYGSDVTISDTSARGSQQTTCSITIRDIAHVDVSERTEPPKKKRMRKQNKDSKEAAVPIFISIFII